MSVCLFLTFRSDSGRTVGDSDIARLERLLRATQKLAKALVHTRSDADDPYLKDESPPAMVMQLYFNDLAHLEVAASRNGPLVALTSRSEFPELSAMTVTQQAMVARPFSVPEPTLKNGPGRPYCTYLVSYEGEAEDLNAWLDHYLEKHTAHMARFPGIRELEVYTRLDWVSQLPWPQANFMQRNKVAFDSPAALTQALHSPVRHEMRADFKAFPPFTGPVNHFAMATRIVRP